MPATQAANRTQSTQQKSAPSIAAGKPAEAQEDETRTVRLHISPFTPALLKVYLAPSVLPLAENISYHTVETFPEKGFGYLELPAMEARKLKKKLNGSTLKGSKVRIEDAKPEKRKAAEDAEVVDDKLAKRAKKEKKKKELDVLEGVELPEDRKVKRGWTEPVTKTKKDKKDKKDKKKQKESKYTKEPELLFNAKLTPVAATEAAHKDKSKSKKKEKKKSKSMEAVIHEFENNTKHPSFLRSTQTSTDLKPAVEYVNGKGWVDEDGNVVEAETGKARNRRVLELVDTVQPATEKRASATPESEPSPTSKPKPKAAKKPKKKQATPPPSSSESEAEESSVVSSSSEDESSEASSDGEPDAKSSASSPAIAPDAPQMILTPSSPSDKKEVHPLEALFKRPKPPSLSNLSSNTTSTSAKGLAPINTSFRFFTHDNDADNMDLDVDNSGNPPVTPYTQRDLEWRGLRSAAPTPDTAAIGRRFSFPWRNGSQEADQDDDESEAGKQLTSNTKANSSVTPLPGLAEEDEEEVSGPDDAGNRDVGPGAGGRQLRSGTRKASEEDGDGEEEESEFAKWFWEKRGENNRAWKRRRREALKAKRLRENRRVVGRRRTG